MHMRGCFTFTQHPITTACRFGQPRLWRFGNAAGARGLDIAYVLDLADPLPLADPISATP